MTTYNTRKPMGSTDPRDLYDNAENYDKAINSVADAFWQDRFGVSRRTWYGLEQMITAAAAKFGLITLTGVSFTTGATVNINEVLLNPADNCYYQWTGAFPPGGKVVPPNSTPQSTGGQGPGKWLNVIDNALASRLAAAGGVKLVNGAVDKAGDTMQRLIITGDATAASTGNLVVGNLPIPAGSDAARDAFTAARLIKDSPTNCHGFADKTVIENASDYGGHGAFDATVTLRGNKIHNHMYAFQDRPIYEGSGTLEMMKGLMSAPTHRGTGRILDRAGVYVNDVVLQSTGTLEQQNGILIEHLQAGSQANVGIHIRQISGLAYYAPNGGRMYQQGVAAFGVDPTVSNFAINFRGDPNGAFYGFATTDGNSASFGVSGDNRIQFVAANEVRLQIKSAATFKRAITPGDDNQTPSGDQYNRWSEVHAGTGTVLTSDGREKSKPVTTSDLSEMMVDDDDSILDAWSDVSIIAFQWLDAIKEKGEDTARWHFGVIAQQVKEAFDAKGIDATRFGLLCYDEWDDQYEIVPKEVVEHPPEYSGLLGLDMQPIIKTESWTEVVKTESTVLVKSAGNRWGIRADQCLWLEAAFQRRERQRLSDRISKLEYLAAGK